MGRGVCVCVCGDASQKIWMREIHFFFIVKHKFLALTVRWEILASLSSENLVVHIWKWKGYGAYVYKLDFEENPVRLEWDN